MSRSRRKTPCSGITRADSDKFFKKQANGKLRARTREALYRCQDYEEFVGPVLYEVSDYWDSAKDGKCYYPLEEYQAEDLSAYLFWLKRYYWK